MNQFWNTIKGPVITVGLMLAALAIHQKYIAPRLAPKKATVATK